MSCSFIHRLSLHVAETKMNSANLALVFGPTLTRAPDTADPRLLHNDVPAINVLIQLCIEHNEFLFGPDSEEDGLSSPPPPPEAPVELDIILSPPPVNESANEVQEFRRIGTPDSFIDTPPPPLEDTQGQYQYPPEDEGGTTTEEELIESSPPEIPSREDKPEYVPDTEDTPLESNLDRLSIRPVNDVTKEDEPHPSIDEPRPSNDESHPHVNEETEEPLPQSTDEQTTPPEQTPSPEQTAPPEPVTPPTSSEESTSNINNFLEQAFEDITAQIDSMKTTVEEPEGQKQTVLIEEKQTVTSKRRDSKKMLDDDDDEGDSDSDSEG